MREPIAISLTDVSKIYKLHGSQADQLIEVLGLYRFGFRTKTIPKEFSALSEISLDVPRGHRIGIVGRNGAGKTTLLKLICGNFSPTKGQVEVNGTVQALMNVGLGFHPEYTGKENIEASLQYNGLRNEEYQQAIDEVIEFCELGEFIDQPFKTYSLGMQARLMFAAATAIRPDILIIDEVLGAGDAYFVAKSKLRVEKLVATGCTMLLVSHSMQQILELCDEAIWLDQGKIIMQGEAFLVVKAYEEYLHGPIEKIADSSSAMSNGESEEVFPECTSDISAECQKPMAPKSRSIKELDNVLLQEPRFFPHKRDPKLSIDNLTKGFLFEAPGGISRWKSDVGLKVIGFQIQTERGVCNTLVAMRPAIFSFTLIAEEEGEYHCRYGIALNDHLGNCITRIFSPEDKFTIKKEHVRSISIHLNPCQVGVGEYTVGISVLDYTDIEGINSAKRYDLLSRSFIVNVELPDSLGAIGGQFFHTAEWEFN